MVSIFVYPVDNIEKFSINASQQWTIADLVAQIQGKLPASLVDGTYLSFRNGKTLGNPSKLLAEYVSSEDDFLDIRINRRLCGGKGGFGSMLRAQGGKMTRRKGKKSENETDSFRTLDGRRVKSVREAKLLASYLETLPAIEKAKLEKKRQKLLALINSKDDTSKAKFEDVEFLDQCETLAEEISQAVNFAFEEEEEEEENVLDEDLVDDKPESSSSSSEEDKSLKEIVEETSKTSPPKAIKALGFFDSEDESD